MFSFKQFVFSAVVLMAIAAGVTRWAINPVVVVNRSLEQRQIDSLTVERINMVSEKQAIIDSLALVSEGFKRELARTRDKVVSYSKIVAHLNVTVDSLEQRQFYTIYSEPLPLDGSAIGTLKVPFSDTLFAKSISVGDSLLRVTSFAGFEEGLFFMDPPRVDVLRDVRLDIAVLMSKDERMVRTLVTSPDFTNLRVMALTELRPKRKRLPWFWIGIGVGVVGWELLR